MLSPLLWLCVLAAVATLSSSVVQKEALGDRVKQLLANLEASMAAYHSGGVASDVLRWDHIANNEVHIMLKLVRYLRALSKRPEESIRKLLSEGYQCNAMHPFQQEAISRHVEMSICSEVEWYKTAQLTFPEAKTIIDVGGNKGYLGSLFVSLWGGGGYGVTPTALSSIFITDKVWVRNPFGFCRDGQNFGIPLHCPAEYTQDASFRARGTCNYKRQGISVTSFDGSSYLVKTLNDVMRLNLSDSQVRAGGVWRYVHAAAGDKLGVVAFTKQSKESRPGFEGGKMRQAHTEGSTEMVNVTTIDHYAASKGISVDVLKIDAEGADGLVIKGALGSIYSTVGLLTFEGYGKGSLTETMISDFDTHGFSCYSTSLAGLFKWNGGCMRGSKKRATKGNIFCASRCGQHPLYLYTSIPLYLHTSTHKSLLPPPQRARAPSGPRLRRAVLSRHDRRRGAGPRGFQCVVPRGARPVAGLHQGQAALHPLPGLPPGRAGRDVRLMEEFCNFDYSYQCLLYK